MEPRLLRWIVACLALGAAFVAAAMGQDASATLPAWELEGLTLLRNAGFGLLAAALAAFALRGVIGRALADDDGAGRAQVEGAAQSVFASPRAQLFWISFAALFIEVMLIRYCNSQLRIFSFYKNVPLIASYVGLGVGCHLGGGRGSHAVSFLLWLIPFAVFLAAGAGAVDGYLGLWAAYGTSEHMLGDVVVQQATASEAFWSQVYIGVFCVLAFLAVGGLFLTLGRLLGRALEQVPRLPAYSLNIAGSLLGVLAFAALSTLETPPWAWFALGLAPLAWVFTRGAQRRVALALAAVSVIGVVGAVGGTIWSRYQKLVVIELPAEAGARSSSSSFLILISDVFYQVAMDLRPESLASPRDNPFPHYDAVFGSLGGSPGRVLIVGAGSGNDVAAALRAGASHVDAVDIDPAIVAVGRRVHPERPYSDPRVTVIIDDARAAFRKLPPASYASTRRWRRASARSCSWRWGSTRHRCSRCSRRGRATRAVPRRARSARGRARGPA